MHEKLPDTNEEIRRGIQDVLTVQRSRQQRAFSEGRSIASELESIGDNIGLEEELKRFKPRQRCRQYEAVLSAESKSELDGLAQKTAGALLKSDLFRPELAQHDANWLTQIGYAYAETIGEIDGYFNATGSSAKDHSTMLGYVGRVKSLVAWEAASLLFSDPKRNEKLTVLAQHGNLGTQHGDEQTVRFGMKLHTLAGEIEAAHGVMRILAETDPMDEKELAALQAANDSLWESSTRLRTFGVKEAIAPSDLAGVNEWLVRSGYDLYEMDSAAREAAIKTFRDPTADPARFTTSPALAQFLGTDAAFMTSNVTATEITHNNTFMGYRINEEELYDAGQKSDYTKASLLLYPNGHLYTWGGLPLKLLAEAYQCPEAYEQLRSSLLALHFDLVVPIHVARMAADKHAQAIAEQPEMPAAARFKDLVVQRSKVITTHGADQVAKEIKAERKEIVEVRKDRKTVIGHTYRLPENFKASSESRRLALIQIGRVLPETGMGYQRYHQRGTRKAAHDLGHRVVRRGDKPAHKRRTKKSQRGQRASR